MNKYKYVISGYFTRKEKIYDSFQEAKNDFKNFIGDDKPQYYYIIKKDFSGYYKKDDNIYNVLNTYDNNYNELMEV